MNRQPGRWNTALQISLILSSVTQKGTHRMTSGVYIQHSNKQLFQTELVNQSQNVLIMWRIHSFLRLVFKPQLVPVSRTSNKHVRARGETRCVDLSYFRVCEATSAVHSRFVCIWFTQPCTTQVNKFPSTLAMCLTGMPHKLYLLWPRLIRTVMCLSHLCQLEGMLFNTDIKHFFTQHKI